MQISESIFKQFRSPKVLAPLNRQSSNGNSSTHCVTNTNNTNFVRNLASSRFLQQSFEVSSSGLLNPHKFMTNESKLFTQTPMQKRFYKNNLHVLSQSVDATSISPINSTNRHAMGHNFGYKIKIDESVESLTNSDQVNI